MSWRIRHGVRWREVDDTLVLYRREPAGFIELDPAGAEMWLQFIAADGDVPRAARQLADDFDLHIDEACRALEAFCEQMVGLELLDRSGGVSSRACQPRRGEM